MEEPKKYLVNGPISPGQIVKYLPGKGGMEDTGGHSLFLGQVRNDIVDTQKVVAIEYSAYEEMVSGVASSLIDKTKKQFEDIREIVLLHSVGRVAVGEISLMILVSAGHRDHAMRGCRHLLELVKENLPVWKKEIFADNSHLWK